MDDRSFVMSDSNDNGILRGKSRMIFGGELTSVMENVPGLLDHFVTVTREYAIGSDSDLQLLIPKFEHACGKLNGINLVDDDGRVHVVGSLLCIGSEGPVSGNSFTLVHKFVILKSLYPLDDCAWLEGNRPKKKLKVRRRRKS